MDNSSGPTLPISQRRPLRVLSLDGGGVRGIVPLAVLLRLKEYMDASPATKDKRPCDLFDVMCGTSTGGILAVLLGLFRMPVDECIELYTNLSIDVFEPGILDQGRGQGLWRRVVGWGFGQATARSIKFEEILKANIKEITGLEGNPSMADFPPTEDRPYVIIIAKRETFHDPFLFTNYSDQALIGRYAHDVPVWEALRATSAAPTFFDPFMMDIPGYAQARFLDGGLGCNNPMGLLPFVLRKTPYSLTHDEKVVYVSLGTGVPKLETLGAGAMTGVTILAAAATECEETNSKVEGDFQGSECVDFFRFNPHGPADAAMDATALMREMRLATESYLSEPSTGVRLQHVATLLTKIPEAVQAQEAPVRFQDRLQLATTEVKTLGRRVV